MGLKNKNGAPECIIGDDLGFECFEAAGLCVVWQAQATGAGAY